MLRLILLSLALAATAQDNFQCPDEFEGYYPHLYSCDKYWKCIQGQAELKLCGNGLAFSDLDQTFTTENCDYVYNINCGNRTELEAPISAPNCPRLFGTFPDPEDCSGFYNCRDGAANRYSCAPGLSYDQRDRVCKWSDQVPDCRVVIEEEGGFVCPKDSGVGLFTKHAHPEDCRQYFVCISGVPREYGCPLGTVFKVGLDSADGKCSDPAEVPECSNYYGDLDFDKQELVRAGVDPEAVGANEVSQTRTRVNRPGKLIRKQETPKTVQIPVTPKKESPKKFERPSRLRPRPTRPVDRLQEEPQAFAAVPVVSSKPAGRPSFSGRPTGPPTPSARPVSFSSPASRPRTPSFSPSPVPVTTTPLPRTVTLAPNKGAGGGDSFDKQPAKVKAGEDYYYYYYYYDDEDEPNSDSKSS